MPSTQRRVPSGHETKSSILYLHSPTVRPKYIVRLSEDPLIQDSLTGPSPMWSYKPEDPATVLDFYHTSHAKLWKVLFKPQKGWPAKEEDIGLDATNPPREI